MFFTIIGYAFLVFFILFLLQIFVENIMKPKSGDKFIFSFYVITPMIIFIFVLLFDFLNEIPIEKAVITYLLFFVISSSWVATYPGIYAACPTLIIALVIHKNKNGTQLEELKELLHLKENSTERIEDAMHDKLIRKNGLRIELTLIGRGVFKFYEIYRRVLGLKLDTI